MDVADGVTIMLIFDRWGHARMRAPIRLRGAAPPISASSPDAKRELFSVVTLIALRAYGVRRPINKSEWD